MSKKNKTNKNSQPRFIYHVKISFTNEDEIKNIFQQAKPELDIRRPILKAEERLEIK